MRLRLVALLGCLLGLSATARAQDAGALPVVDEGDASVEQSPSPDETGASDTATEERPAPADDAAQVPPERRKRIEDIRLEDLVEDPVLRGFEQHRTREARGSTSIGGYGELHYNLTFAHGTEDNHSVLDLHRLAILLSHRFSSELRFHAGIEVEHALAAPDAPGRVGIEQAYLDYRVLGDALGVRAGVILVPMGILNEWHEPATFHGVERPRVEELIIPTTWREGGIGIFGEPITSLRYELYLVGGLSPVGFSATESIREGRQNVAEGVADGPAVTARVEYEPVRGLALGLGGYFGLAGPNADDLYRLVGFDSATGMPILAELDLDMPVVGGALDARFHWRAIEARAVLATFHVGDTAALRQAVASDGTSLDLDIGSQTIGAYVEVGYDVLSFIETRHELLPFVRLEHYDTMWRVAGRARTPVDDALGVTDLVFGLTYRPLSLVAFKADLIVRNPDGPSPPFVVLDLGVGASF